MTQTKQPARKVRDPMRIDTDVTDRQQSDIQAIKTKAEDLFRLYEHMGATRYAALAKTALEESVMWAVKGVAVDGPLDTAPVD